ncbi:hypothetical protein EBX31_00195 [bacterium]|nr:hypothetical protein [bacterium]
MPTAPRENEGRFLKSSTEEKKWIRRARLSTTLASASPKRTATAPKWTGSATGWTTEKLVDPLHVNTIPIHWGDPRTKEFFNPASFISAHNFRNLRELADYVLHVDETPELYARYLQATPFRENRPSPVFDQGRLVDFFRTIFENPQKPVTQRRWFFPLTKWRLVKRNKLPGQ